MEIVFNNAVFLWFLLAIPCLIIVHFLTLKYSRKSALRFSNFEAIARVTREYIATKPYTSLFLNRGVVLLTLRILALSLLILAVAGTVVWYEGETSDFDFVLAIDSSSSMLADDFTPNRLEATKVAAGLFVDILAHQSKVGLVTFGGTSYVEQKPTSDFALLKGDIANISVSRVGGTDLATAIVTSSNLLIGGERGKAVILLTDGQSNVGASIDDGITYANNDNVIVHTIGVGTEQGGKFLGVDVLSRLDEDTLQRIASLTGGEYFRADNKDALVNAYKDISGLTTRKLSLSLTPIFLVIALLFSILEWVLLNTIFKTIG
jgi:Ca-activated chloride channel family protein